MPNRANPSTRQPRVIGGLAAIATLLCLTGIAAAQNPLLGPGAQVKSPWRGSFVNVTNSVSVNTLDEDAQLTYNPNYTLSTTANMRYWLNDQINLRLGVGFSREFTNNDFTTQDGEIFLNDTTIGVGAFMWSIPVINVLTIGAFDLRLPTGPFSQAQTLIVAAQPRVIFFKQFGFIGFNVAYVTGFNRNFNEFTTASTESASQFCPVLADCVPTDTGVRNPRLRLVNALALGIQPTGWFGMSSSVTVLHDYLYPKAEAITETFAPQEEQNTRTLMAYNIEAFFLPHPTLILAVGASSFGPQRMPNAENYRPFFNRFTNIVADVRINVSQALALLED